MKMIDQRKSHDDRNFTKGKWSVVVSLLQQTFYSFQVRVRYRSSWRKRGHVRWCIIGIRSTSFLSRCSLRMLKRRRVLPSALSNCSIFNQKEPVSGDWGQTWIILHFLSLRQCPSTQDFPFGFRLQASMRI